MNFRRAINSVAIAAVGVLSLGTVGTKAAVFLTDAILFSTDAGGGAAGGQVWDTQWNGNFDLLFQWGGVTGGFLNGVDDRGPNINVPLHPGLAYVYTLWGAPGADVGAFGLNLFFNGATTPGISVYAPTYVGGEVPAFLPNGAQNTIAFNEAGEAPGANSAIFTSGGVTVKLTEFHWAAPEVLRIDAVGTASVGADGTPDFIGGLTLQVVPEPQHYALIAGAGLAGLAFCRRFCRRGQCG